MCKDQSSFELPIPRSTDRVTLSQSRQLQPPRDLSTLLRMYCMANCFNLADEACEDAMYDIVAFRQFCGIDLGRQGVPDATTLLDFRHLLKMHKLGAAIFVRVGELLMIHGLKLSDATIVDATIIAAPNSTKNGSGQRDPEMHSTSKGGHWHYGMKTHLRVDSASGIVHSASVTAANVHDSQQLPKLLHGKETRLYGDSAANKKEVLTVKAPKAKSAQKSSIHFSCSSASGALPNYATGV